VSNLRIDDSVEVRTKTNKYSCRYLIKLLFLNIIHFFSFIFPRDKNIWVFGSWDGKVFMDNSKYLFLFVNHYFPRITPVWISRSKTLVEDLRKRGLKAYYIWDLKAIYYCLRAKYYVIDHAPCFSSLFSPINLWLSGNAKIIQLWHGVPLKRIDRSPPTRTSMYQKISMFDKMLSELSRFNLINVKINTYVVAPSRFFGRILASTFKVPETHIIISGYPRNYGFQIPEEKRVFNLRFYKLIKKYKRDGRKILFYIPTFRDSGRNSLVNVLANLERLKRFLKENNAVLVIKLHKADVKRINIKADETIILLPQHYDIYEILSLGDVLITDYSSIFFDFLLLDRPIIFFAYDIEEYQKYDREFYFSYETFVPGPVVFDFEELLDWINTFINQRKKDKYREKRKKLRSFVFSCDCACDELVEKIMNLT